MLKRGGRHFSKEEWKKNIAGYFLLLDYTDSAFSKRAAEKGEPWFMGKA
jgi:2-keto-4-pentenoate hydratase/2-oxohepta-3-ene-1,7-dioic acid hydratase in catechol pathway